MRLNRYTEDLVRDVKHSDSDLEPQQHFKRTADRNTANLQWSSRAGKSDWTVETNYSRIKENDVASLVILVVLLMKAPMSYAISIISITVN